MFRTELFDALDPAVSIAVDFGLNLLVSEDMSVAFVADDLLGRYTWNTAGVNGSDGKKTTDYFPTRLRLGVSRSFMDKRLLLLAEFESRTSRLETVSRRIETFGAQPLEVVDRKLLTFHETRYRVGAEYAVSSQFIARFGTTQQDENVLSGLRPSLGFMVSRDVGNLHARFEYTFAREFSASGSMHVFSTTLFF